jgi:hypothetical protein
MAPEFITLTIRDVIMKRLMVLAAVVGLSGRRCSLEAAVSAEHTLKRAPRRSSPVAA